MGKLTTLEGLELNNADGTMKPIVRVSLICGGALGLWYLMKKTGTLKDAESPGKLDYLNDCRTKSRKTKRKK